MKSRLKAAILAVTTAAALAISPAAPASASAPWGAPGCFSQDGHGYEGRWTSSAAQVFGFNQRFCLWGADSDNAQLQWIEGDLVAYAGNSGYGGAMLWASNLNGAGRSLTFETNGDLVIRDSWNNVIWRYTAIQVTPQYAPNQYRLQLDYYWFRGRTIKQTYSNNPYNTTTYNSRAISIR
jgi:hypothetical protein